MQEANLINDFAGIRQDYDHLEFALHILDCVGKVSQEGDQHSEFLFNLLGHTLKTIEQAKDVLILKMHFYLRFLLQQGVITPEPWMAPFLRTNLADTNTLLEYRQIVDDELSNVENMFRHYIANASL